MSRPITRPANPQAIPPLENQSPGNPLPASAIAAAVAGLLAAWIVAGSTGLIGHPLRHALGWIAVVALLVSAWPAGLSLSRWLIFAAALLAAALLLFSRQPTVNVLGVALLLSALACFHASLHRQVLLIAASAVAVLGLYRLALTGIPTLWHLADAFAGILGFLGALVGRQPLSIGPTFAGLDYLVPMAVLWLAILQLSPDRRTILRLGATIPLGHLLYLGLLAALPPLLGPASDPGVKPDHPWIELIRPLIPWNLPALAALIHAAIAAVLLRWTTLPHQPAGENPRPYWTLFASCAAALLLVFSTNLWFTRPSLEGKKVVLFEKGYLNWLKPQHGDYGRLSIGMYGMMPQYLRGLGAKEVIVSPELSEPDLKDASVLIMFYPDKKWAVTPDQLQRIEQFVRAGGSLMVMGEHTIHEPDGDNPPVSGDRGESRFNQVLQPTGMYVRFDSATFQVGGWLQSYENLAHPAITGIKDDRNQLGVVIGASVAAPWPARPIIVGRWGWADPGDEGGSAMMGNHRYDPGDRLGDIVLAAEKPLGAGKVIAFGDTSTMNNGINIGAHLFTSRLMGYLADGPHNPQALWRQMIGLLLTLFLLAMLIRTDGLHIGAIALTIGLMLPVCIAITQKFAQVLPDGRAAKPNNLAYIMNSHLEAASGESWRNDGTMGLSMTLMRSGYLTLLSPDLSAERLQRAGILVAIAPHREFTGSERDAIRSFVEGGGILICTVGYDDAGPSRQLLADYGMWVGSKTQPGDEGYLEPRPLGHFKSPYLPNGDGGYFFVRFHAGWPVGCELDHFQALANGAGDLPVILVRRFGAGKVALIGDSGFAMNKNLENEDGSPFEGLRENADFWRWFLTYLTDQEQQWIPPKPKTATTAPLQPEPAPAGPTTREGNP